MKLTQLAPGGLSQTKAVPGLLHCQIEYEVKTGTGTLDYTGPKFAPQLWHQVLSFFRWTHAEMNSESQVRLYVNLRLGRWGAWAFPQEARTGLNAREIATRETPEQAAARFASWGTAPSADWLYFGTVHHHCAASAFQSDTDAANECRQDGLHVTVGRMDAERHELHARFYLGGNRFAADLSRFWPVAPDLAARVPPALHDELARFEMGESVDATFPDAWRHNVIEVPMARVPVREREFWPEDSLALAEPEWWRVVQARHDLADSAAVQGYEEETLCEWLHHLASDPAAQLILETCLKHQVRPEALLEEIQADAIGT
jgi:hypothetical protein